MLLGHKVEMELNEVAGGRHLAQVQWFRTWESIRLTSNLEQWVPGPRPRHTAPECPGCSSCCNFEAQPGSTLVQ